jgi:large subunit ribosomal protein L24
MQKVIRRTVMAEKQAARRLAKRKADNARQAAKSEREQARMARSLEVRDIKQAAINRREDWELGPLAPRRDVGTMKDAYATVDGQRLRGPVLPLKEREAIMKAWGGGWGNWKTDHLNIAEGDRMVVLEGRDKGKIGTITAIDIERCEVTLEGLNMVRTFSDIPPMS